MSAPSSAPGPGRESRPRRSLRDHAATVLAIAAGFCLTLGLLASWTERTVFDGPHFADRATRLLDSEDIRRELADEFTDALIDNGATQLISFRSTISAVVADLADTPVFRDIFRNAVLQAHQAVFTKDGADAIVDLSSALGVVESTIRISDPDLASRIPSDVSSVLIDVTDQIRGLELWQASEDLNSGAQGLLVIAVLAAIAAVFLDSKPRNGVLKLGVATVVSGLFLVAFTLVIPSLVARAVPDPGASHAVEVFVGGFVGDLRVLGIWVIGYGVIAAALATATVPRHEPLDLRRSVDAARYWFAGWQPATPTGRAFRAVVVAFAGLVLILARDRVIPLAVALLGAYVLYLGVVQLLVVVGRTPADVAVERAELADLEARAGSRAARSRRARPGVAVAVTAAVLALLLSGAGFAATRSASRHAAIGPRSCNGSPELCDRRLDEVVFPASHNSMSAASDPGWLFAQNPHGIPTQLEYGIRAFLVKTHYGVPTGVTVTGGNLVVTDRAAEIAVNPRAGEAELDAAAVQRANELAASAHPNPNAKPGLYLCHVYCELGATPLSDTLATFKSFLDRNPDEVIIFFVGNYISTEDTQQAFSDAGLLDRLWEYDPSQPPPTLGQMIDARRNIFMLSEFSGPPPPWNNEGYGLFQDTPYTFTQPSDLEADTGPAYDVLETSDTTDVVDTALSSGTTVAWSGDWQGDPSCRPNRGTPDSPLFQINHWITNADPPSPDVAAQVNAYDVLMPRARACMAERGRFPTIIGVDFYNQGDLLRVVDELNGVDDVDR